MNCFYSISITNNIELQGFYKSEIAQFIKKYKFTTHIDPNGYVKFDRSDIEITLT